ncbi:MAG TPA: hypothetical protein VGQ06_02170 [Gemmatimonadales bacterium]|nr:hypothetical protein [Gemmatimonadales bacterium]
MSSIGSKLDALKLAVGDLIDRRDTSSDLGDLRRYADDPLGFFRDVLHVEPWSKQEEIAQSVVANRKSHVRGAVGVGKDAAGGWIALWWAYAREGLCLVTSSTARQVVEQMMRREIGGAFRRAKLPGELLTTGLRVGEETRILAFTSQEGQSYRGFHHPRTLVLISEASGVDAEAWEGLLDCAVGADDRVLVYGNPISPVGPFFDAYRRPGWHKIRVSALDLIDTGREIPGAVTAEWVAEQDTDSPFYASRVLGEFPENAINALIRREWLEQAAALHKSGVLGDSQASYRCALDVAHSEMGDQSCLCITRGAVVHGFKLWREPNARTLRKHVVEALHALRIYRNVPADIPAGMVSYPDGLPPASGTLVVDARGVGGPVCDELRADNWPISKYDSGARAKKADRFNNTRAESYWTLREKLEKGKLAMAYDADVWEELLALRWSENHKKQIEIESKKELRRTLGRSPDRADALAMAVGHKSIWSGLVSLGQW